MYSDAETRISKNYLSQILTGVSQPPCLIGGWAVFFTVNDKFKEEKGRDYLGSRDIDLGFHLDPNWNSEEYENPSFKKTVVKLAQMGFEQESYRFVKRFHSEEGRELTAQESRSLAQYLTFNMYVDLLVDSDDPKRHEIAERIVLESHF